MARHAAPRVAQDCLFGAERLVAYSTCPLTDATCCYTLHLKSIFKVSPTTTKTTSIIRTTRHTTSSIALTPSVPPKLPRPFALSAPGPHPRRDPTLPTRPPPLPRPNTSRQPNSFDALSGSMAGFGDTSGSNGGGQKGGGGASNERGGEGGRKRKEGEDREEDGAPDAPKRARAGDFGFGGNGEGDPVPLLHEEWLRVEAEGLHDMDRFVAITPIPSPGPPTPISVFHVPTPSPSDARLFEDSSEGSGTQDGHEGEEGAQEGGEPGAGADNGEGAGAAETGGSGDGEEEEEDGDEESSGTEKGEGGGKQGSGEGVGEAVTEGLGDGEEEEEEGDGDCEGKSEMGALAASLGAASVADDDGGADGRSVGGAEGGTGEGEEGNSDRGADTREGGGDEEEGEEPGHQVELEDAAVEGGEGEAEGDAGEEEEEGAVLVPASADQEAVDLLAERLQAAFWRHTLGTTGTAFIAGPGGTGGFLDRWAQETGFDVWRLLRLYRPYLEAKVKELKGVPRRR